MEPVLETFFRTLGVLLWVAAGFRLVGKRQLGQFNIYDLAMVMLVANAVQNAMTRGSGSLLLGLVCAGTLLAAGRLLSAIFVRRPRLESFLVGAPTILARDGVLLKDRLQRERVSEEEVLMAIRAHGLDGLSQVRLVVLEVDGALSVIPRKDTPAGTGQAENGAPPQGE